MILFLRIKRLTTILLAYGLAIRMGAFLFECGLHRHGVNLLKWGCEQSIAVLETLIPLLVEHDALKAMQVEA